MIGLEKQSTKDIIVHTLMANWPVGMKKIYTEVKKQRPVSYHAIYKLVRQMVESGVLEMNERGYFINKEWIENVVDFGQRLKSVYARKSGKEQDTFVFNTVADTDNYLMTLGSAENQTKIVQCGHMWWALFRPETAFTRMQRAKTYRSMTYVICSNDTVADRWCASFERKLGKNVRLGVECARNCDTFVRGDTVIEVFYPRRLLDVIDRIYGRAKRVDEINLKQLIQNFYMREGKVMVSVKKSGDIAERIREETISHFGARSKKVTG